MKLFSRFLIIVPLLGCVLSVAAQELEDSVYAVADTIEAGPRPHPHSSAVPASFRNPGENVITDPDQHLYPIYLALLDIKEGEFLDSLRVLHIGDSHIRGHIFPQTFGKRLAADFGAVEYRDLGINGATFRSYMNSSRMDDVYAWQPDLIIISFGTNEAYGRYDGETHYRQIDDLIILLQENLPYACLLFTTPAGCYLKGGRHNPNNLTCAQTINRYAKEHALPVYDLFAVGGGEANACANWKRSRMLRPDGVHFTPDGYRTQGNMLYEAFKRSYDAASLNM